MKTNLPDENALGPLRLLEADGLLRDVALLEPVDQEVQTGSCLCRVDVRRLAVGLHGGLHATRLLV